MTDRAEDILPSYERHELGEEFRLERHQLERDITLRYLADYLPASGRVLEIGAATGAYTAWLAERGYDITAVDLSEAMIERCRVRIADLGLAERVSCHAADARDLSTVPGNGFDAVLMMGPLYHLTQEANRLRAIRQAVSRLAPGGVLISAWISRYGLFGDLLAQMPELADDDDEMRALLDLGRDRDGWPSGGFYGYFATVEEIAPLHEAAGLTTELLVGVEPAIGADDEIYNRLEGERRSRWLGILYEISRQPSMAASSRHLLYIGRKGT